MFPSKYGDSTSLAFLKIPWRLCILARSAIVGNPPLLDEAVDAAATVVIGAADMVKMALSLVTAEGASP